MDILSLTMTAAGGLGVGVVLGAMCLRPRVGPWHGCTCREHPATTTAAISPAWAHATLAAHLARQISTHPTVTPDSLESAYVNTGRGLVPVLVDPATLVHTVSAAGRTPLPALGETAEGSQ
ncbi:hypothetical protein ACWDOR_43210 [Streptosporangium canum]